MTLSFAPHVEKALAEQARQRGRTPESLVEEAVLEKLALVPENSKGYDLESRDEWERLLRSAASPAGVSLTDEQVSSDGIYQDHD